MSEFYKSLYRKYYIPENELQERINNAANFATLLSTQLELLEPIWDWYLNFYFNGIDENAQTTPFAEDVKKFAKSGYTVMPLVLHEAVGSIAINSPLGMICDIWDPQTGLDDIEKERVIELLKGIKLKTSMWCNEVFWDYFIENCWKELFSSVFEFYYGTTYKRATENFINEKINKIIKNEGLEFAYIKQISNNMKMSCFGIDMSSSWPLYKKGPYVLKVN